MAEPIVDVNLYEWGLDGVPATAQEGTVTFDAINTGVIAHNLVVIRTDLPVDGLPVGDDGLVIEDQLDVRAKTEQFFSGETMSLTANLPPGNYVLICNNMPAHYTAGMRQGFTVTALPRSPTPTFVPGQPTPTQGQPSDGDTADGTTGGGAATGGRTARTGTQAGGVPSVGSGPQEERTENWWALAGLAVAGAGLLGLGALTHRWAQQQG